ncbi:YPO1635 family putative outer membrane beta-barrel protein [Yersinia pseudotuberculosis]|uniref:Porin family protein n=1 Tax=Yersinia pseudotuberculosis TaxID=633 RepID=A0ABM7AJD8_YERPU|nr:outer membrane beta-barrel protein [Yersinia pseudotuberculosis]AYW92791.1 porin family protein [Yersinia pseudotuberculosis]AYW97012.1 porin family protein [Yersinia pseudotuberculosis]KGA61862.1 outer membrane beta-barrel domain protein [Yersinia pseudotuberculosis]MBO1628942.1 porin family protein [Yersinia pseudotuberculosis]MBP0068531.1 outer membrane beta-barrel protein [Yersinia pseudotuberculosis]
MLKQSLLSLALMGSCSVAMADNYTYVAGGLQFGSINSNSRFDQQFDRQNYSHIGNKNMGGIYLNGGYSFDNSLFIDGRLSSLANDNRGSADAVLGLGYYFAFTPDIDFYTVVGASRHALVFDASKDGKKTNTYNSASGEVGVKTKLSPDIGVNIAYRLANYDKRAFHEARIMADYALTQKLAAEVGYTYHNWRVSDQAMQVGLRYNF